MATTISSKIVRVNTQVVEASEPSQLQQSGVVLSFGGTILTSSTPGIVMRGGYPTMFIGQQAPMVSGNAGSIISGSGNYAELSNIAASFFAVGFSAGFYVMEMGAGLTTVSAQIAAWNTWKAANPGIFYCILTPAAWDIGPAPAEAVLSSSTGPASPVLTESSAGTLAQATYYVRTTYLTSGGAESPLSPEASLLVNADNVLNVASPSAQTGFSTYNVYVGTVSGEGTLQNATPITLGTHWVEPTSGLIAGTAMPTPLGAATYYARLSYLNSSSVESQLSPDVYLNVAIDYVLNVASPAAQTDMTHYNVYVGTVTGTETLQNTSPIAIGTNWVEPSTGLISGATAPLTLGDLVKAASGPNAQFYHFITASEANSGGYPYKSAFVFSNSPNMQVGVFDCAAVFYSFLANTPAPNNLLAGMGYRQMPGTTEWPDENAATVQAILTNNANLILSGAQGGFPTTQFLFRGTLGDGSQASAWYGVDWVAIQMQQALNADILNGSNRQPPCSTTQKGWKSLRLSLRPSRRTESTLNAASKPLSRPFLSQPTSQRIKA